MARIRHLYSIASPAVANLFLCTLDFKDAKKRHTSKNQFPDILNTKLTKKTTSRPTSFKSNPNRAKLGAALKHAGKLIEKRI